jgi:hypothetical protein
MNEFVTIRKVTNGWIVHLNMDPSIGVTTNADTLVFESMEALVAGIQTIYNEELDNEC